LPGRKKEIGGPTSIAACPQETAEGMPRPRTERFQHFQVLALNMPKFARAILNV
jgi:hypothetical protein